MTYDPKWQWYVFMCWNILFSCYKLIRLCFVSNRVLESPFSDDLDTTGSTFFIASRRRWNGLFSVRISFQCFFYYFIEILNILSLNVMVHSTVFIDRVWFGSWFSYLVQMQPHEYVPHLSPGCLHSLFLRLSYTFQSNHHPLTFPFTLMVRLLKH